MDQPSEIETVHNCISFYAHHKDEPIMVLDRKGMIYKGVRIEDAGQAHDAWMETMKAMQISWNSA